MKTQRNGNARILETINGLHISIPSKKVGFVIIAASIWLIGWILGLNFALEISQWQNGIAEIDSFILIWILFWIVGGGGVFVSVLWGLFGKEELFLPKSGSDAYFKKSILGLGIKRRLDKSQILNFRFNEVPANLEFTARRGLSVWGWGPGKIKFDYGMKIYSLGLGLDDAEANYLVYLLGEKTN
ncbi:MAG: hypothetical protein R8P61_04650 [Bacteroidia bacterium]|nr:hypothetical protein [Bacteroidia bacterium]